MRDRKNGCDFILSRKDTKETLHRRETNGLLLLERLIMCDTRQYAYSTYHS